MSNIFIRVEAVNLDNFIYDTQDISTIRGGSFMLLEAVEKLTRVKAVPGIEKISTGASTGLFKVLDGHEKKITSIIQEIKVKLSTETYGYGTFVVNYHDFDEDNNDFSIGTKTLLAKNHIAQWKQPTLIYPEETGFHMQCDKDGIRPAVVDDDHCLNKDEKEKKYISNFTYFRREYGKALKKNEIYKNIIMDRHFHQKIDTLKFTDNLEELSKDYENKRIDGKIAFIYMDGNKFGKIKDKEINTLQHLQNFDDSLKVKVRQEFLKSVLTYASNETTFKRDDDKIRFELLMWGGDELEIVVPAWQGLHLLELFYQQKEEFKKWPLTHACGIVFCHHNAPILQVRKIAHGLVDSIKDQIPDIPQKRETGDHVKYLVMESFDMIAGGPEHFFDYYYGNAVGENLILQGQEIKTLVENIKDLKKYFPRTKLYQIIHQLRQDKFYLPHDDVNRALAESSREVKEKVENILEKILGNNFNRFYLIADLWDFIN